MPNIISEKEFLQKYVPQECQKIQHNFIQSTIEKYPYIDSEIISLATMVLFNYDSITQLKYPVITLRMGLGKTTILHAYIQYMLAEQANYGAIVSVERVETIKELCKKFPNYVGIYGFRKEDCLAKYTTYNPNQCRICKIADCRLKLQDEYCSLAPVILMTHQRLHLMMKDERLREKYTMFYLDDANHTQVKRRDLFIDECPGFYMLKSITKKDIRTFQYALHSTYQRDCSSRRLLTKYFATHSTALTQELETGISKLQMLNSKHDALIFDNMCRQMLANYYGHSYQTVMNVQSAMRQSGFVTQGKKVISLINNVANLYFKTYIFDGTATLDATYPEQARIIDFKERRSFTNTHIYADTRHNASKTYYDHHPNFIADAVDQIRQELVRHNKILILCFLEDEEVYRQYFTEKEHRQLYINHFNNTKGNNNYGDASCVFLLGTIYKGDEFYLELYNLYRTDKVLISDIQFKSSHNQRLPYFISDNTQFVELSTIIAHDQAIMSVQEIMRGQIRNNATLPLDIYLSSTNPEYVKTVQEGLPGSSLHTITNAPKRNEVEEYILEKFTHNTIIKKSNIRKDCCVSTDRWKEISQSKPFKAFLEQRNIIMKRYTLHHI